MSTTDPVDPSDTSAAPAAGLVVLAGREPLAGTLLHGEPLVTHARRALAAAGIRSVEQSASWASLQELGLPVVLHDPLCPLTPAAFLNAAVEAAADPDTAHVVVGCRPVTDTIKTLTGDLVGETVDRETLLSLTSPVVLSAAAVRALDEWPQLADMAALVGSLRARLPVTFLESPALGRRVEDPSAVLLLEAFEELHPTSPRPPRRGWWRRRGRNTTRRDRRTR